MSQTALPYTALNQGFVVAIELDARPGEEATVAAGLQALVAPTMAEPGVKLFLPYRSPTDPKAFFIFELYVEEADWAAHQETRHFQKFVADILPLLARRERVPFVPFVPAECFT